MGDKWLSVVEWFCAFLFMWAAVAAFFWIMSMVTGCVDHDAQLLRYRIDKCVERTFVEPIDRLRQKVRKENTDVEIH